MEEEEETQGRCGRGEEEIYWTHFHFTRFSLLLHPGFEQCLALPEQFSSYLQKKLPKTVTLIGPSGIKWRVELMALGNALYFGHGWAEFVKDHFLQEKDLLVFKYDGKSCFNVLMFDRDNYCEKPASYFVRKRLCKEQSSRHKTTREMQDNVCLDVSQNVDKVSSSKIAGYKINKSPEGQPRVSPLTNKRNHFEKFNSIPSSSEETSFHDEEIKTIPAVHSESGRRSRRLQLTEKDKANALQLAKAAISSKGFTVVMKPTRFSAKGKYHLPIPTKWITTNLTSLEKQDVILRFNGNSWCTKFSCRSNTTGGLSAGWKKFIMQNKLQSFDVCAFELGTPENNVVVLDVNIFRVREKVSPPTLA